MSGYEFHQNPVAHSINEAFEVGKFVLIIPALIMGEIIAKPDGATSSRPEMIIIDAIGDTRPQGFTLDDSFLIWVEKDEIVLDEIFEGTAIANAGEIREAMGFSSESLIIAEREIRGKRAYLFFKDTKRGFFGSDRDRVRAAAGICGDKRAMTALAETDGHIGTGTTI